MHNTKPAVALGLLFVLSLAVPPALGHDKDHDQRIRVRMNGFAEVPALSAPGKGRFTITIDRRNQSIDYVLAFEGMGSDVTQAHIHLGQRGVNGGISVFLCSNLGNGPAGTQACPLREGTVTGTIVAANVIGPAGQGIAAGEFDELLRAIDAGATYANVHTTQFPAGEIRAQIERR
jgi:hypothetical protein